MTPHRETLIRNLLSVAGQVHAYGRNDLSSTDNTVASYIAPENQWRYVHQYFAKFVGCWRWVRERVQAPNDGPVISIGAGPELCLFGWFFDVPPNPGQEVVACDVLPWTTVTASPEHLSLRADILGSAQYAKRSGVYFPQSIPPQCAAAGASLTPLDPNSIPTDATVLLPFVLNHLLGATQPHPDPSSVFGWLNAARLRARRVVLVDLQWERAEDFWARVFTGLGLAIPATSPSFNFRSDTAKFATSYAPQYGRFRTGADYPHFCAAVGLAGDGSGWYLLRE